MAKHLPPRVSGPAFAYHFLRALGPPTPLGKYTATLLSTILSSWSELLWGICRTVVPLIAGYYLVMSKFKNS